MSIEQVAKYAGVSTATVSRVLNSVPVVSESTVRSVRAAISALNYDPLAVKRGPKPGKRRISSTRTGMIAVMTVGLHRDRLRFPVTGSVVAAISRAAKQSDVRVLLDEMPDLSEISSVIQNREVDGAVVFLADEAPLDILAEMHRYVPIVWAMGGQAGPLPVDHVSENNLAVGYLAYQYLAGKGCGDVAFLTQVPQKRNARQRGQGLLGASADAGHYAYALLMGEDPNLAVAYGSGVTLKPTLGELVEAFAHLNPRPRGLFVDRDSTLVKVYPLLQKFGLQPGRDVIVVSCDNEEVALSALVPRPATIDLGGEELGGRIMRRLLLRIENPQEPPIMVQTQPRLVLVGNDG